MVRSLGEECATHFLLGEIELALLDLHSDTTSFDVLAATVTADSVCQRVAQEDGPPLVHTSAAKLGQAHSVPLCSRSSLATEIWKSVGGSGDRSAEEARSLPLIGTC